MNSVIKGIYDHPRQKSTKYACFWHVYARICLDGESVWVWVEIRAKGKPLEETTKVPTRHVRVLYAVGAGHEFT